MRGRMGSIGLRFCALLLSLQPYQGGAICSGMDHEKRRNGDARLVCLTVVYDMF